MIIRLTEYPNKKPALVNLDNVTCVRSNDITDKIPIVGVTKAREGSVIVFTDSKVLVVQETVEEILKQL